MDVKRINDHISVSGQISPEDIAALKAQGYTTIINNRPDGEAPDQPAAIEIEAAAKAAGLGYHHIPLGRTGVTAEMVEQTKAALEQSEGPVFAFCRSGTRSTWLWALARGRAGADGDDLVSKAAAAGYDLAPLRRFLP